MFFFVWRYLISQYTVKIDSLRRIDYNDQNHIFGESSFEQ